MAGRYDDRVHCNSKTVKNVYVRTTSSAAAVFTKRRRVPGYSGLYNYRSYACMFREGPISYLQRSDETRSALGPELSGRFLAFRQYFAITEFGSSSGVVVLDMQRGEVVLESPRQSDETNAVAWVVKRNGSAAWTTVAEESPEVVVWRAEASDGFERERLDAGPDIDPHSLRMSSNRRTISWSRDRRTVEID